MFFVLRNKLPRIAATKLSAQAPQWSERASSGSESDDDSELPTTSHQPYASTHRSHTADRPYLRIGDRADGRILLNSRNPHSWQDKDKKRHQLMSAANQLRNHGGGMDHVLVLNLGDPWTDPSQLQLFDNRVIDIPIAEQTAPGSDLIPLDILFTICSSMHSWLRINDKNVTFLHANNQAVSSGESTLKFVVGCFMAYLGDSDRTAPNQPTSDQKTKESHWKVNNKAFVTPQEPDSEVSQVMYSVGIDTNKISSYGGPARRRYAQYFLSILYTPNPPPSQDSALAVDHVVISGLDEIKTNLRVTRLLSERWKDSLLHPVLVIYQSGKLKWKGVVPIKDSTVEVSPEVSVRGDCVVGLWFVKDCISTNDPPVVAFSFHSAFMESGVVRLSSGDLSCLGMDMNQMLDNPACNVTMELTLTYGESSDEEEEAPEEVQNLSFSDYRNRWLAQRGGLPSIYATVQDSQKREAPSRRLRPPMPEPAPVKEDPLMTPEMPTVKPALEESVVGEQESPTEAPKTPVVSESSIQRHPHKQTGAEEGREASTSGQKAEDKKAEVPKKKASARAPGPPPPPPPPPRTKLRRTPSGTPIPPPQKSRPVSKTKSFFWDITPKQSGTVWSELTQGELEPTQLAMLESLFCHDDQLKSRDTDKSAMSASKKPGTALALSVGRANNVSIMMTRFKHFSGIDEICKGVLTGEGLTDEELYLLAQICPTECEIKELKEHKEEDLSIPEKILLATRNWEKHYSDAIDMLETIRSSCQQIKESKRLQHVFAAILSVGNTMNRGTSRGNAGCIKIESLSRLWDTRVSGNATSAATPAPLQRSGSVPTAISQALEGPRVEEKIMTLLDFTAVIVHEKDFASGHGTHPNSHYLLLELESLSDAVQYLEDGVSELLSEVDHGFELLEKEFRSMTGKSWSVIESTTLTEIKIRNCDSFVEEQRGFLKKSHQFLIEAGGARNFLKQEQSVVEQHLKSAVQWLGESSSENPKLHLKRLLEFAKRFDQSYNQLKPCLTSISE